MKRWMWILCGLLAFQLMEKTGAQVEKLQPVQLLEVQRDENQVILRTDTENMGRGRTLSLALADLEETSPKRIFLETADFLLLGQDTMDLLPELKAVLRPAVQVAGVREKLDLMKAADYLERHKPGTELRKLHESSVLPVLNGEKGRLKLGKNYG